MKNGDSSDDEGVEEEVNGGNPAIAGDDEVGSGIGRCLARAARYRDIRLRSQPNGGLERREILSAIPWG
jgi:hypothetical protein